MTKRVENWGPEGFFLGMLVGAVIGAGVAILLASETGSRLREGLADRVDQALMARLSQVEDAGAKEG